ncbi:hypothetical protein D3C87_1522320 [compost metagenome]
MAMWDPSCAPSALATPMDKPSQKIILPANKKSVRAARLVARLTTRAFPLPVTKSKPRKLTKQNMRKVPVPGPMRPSYTPMAKAAPSPIARVRGVRPGKRFSRPSERFEITKAPTNRMRTAMRLRKPSAS